MAHTTRSQQQGPIVIGRFSSLSPECFQTFSSGKLSFTSAEQFFQAAKAAKFGDKESFKKIMNTSDPDEVKRLGSLVNHFDDNVWAQGKLVDSFENQPVVVEFQTLIQSSYAWRVAKGNRANTQNIETS
jgi:predicted NAD-dependent protein-ADP-ribosyltransferase YbiA (DUF1768 family)